MNKEQKADLGSRPERVEVASADIAALLQFADIYMPSSLVTAWEAPINRACSRLAEAIGYPTLEGEHRAT